MEDPKTLANGICGLTDGSVAGDWRLPTIDELKALISGPGVPVWIANGGTARPYQWLTDWGFSSVSNTWPYWSSTTYEYYTNDAWYIEMYNGSAGKIYKGDQDYFLVWPIRGGQLITGTVFDVVNGTPVAGADVSINYQTYKTDATGVYSSARLAPGAYTVTVSKEGFQSQNQTVSVDSSQQSIQNFLMTPMVRVTVDIVGTGGGTVNSTIPTSGLIICSKPPLSSDICTTVQPYNTFLTLIASPGSSSLAAWSGCDPTADNSCNFTLTGDRTVTATFTYVKPVRIAGSNPLREYDSLQAAYDDTLTLDGAVIQAQEFTFTENLNLDKTKNVNINGGFCTVFISSH
jgi:hypothetical protein